MRTITTRNTSSPMTSSLIVVYVMTVLFIIFTNLATKNSRLVADSQRTKTPVTNNVASKATLVSYKLP